MKRYGNVLVLGGGGVKGLAHIGVLKAIEEKRIEISAIVGCSMGALIGSVYALGTSAEAIEGFVKALDMKRWLSFRVSPFEVFNSAKIENKLKQFFGDTRIEELKIPTYINAFDINNFEHVVFKEGLLRTAIRASISVPGLFSPVRMGERLLVDGGLYETLPLSIAHSLKPKKIIAVNVLSRSSLNTVWETADEGESMDIKALRKHNILNISFRAIVSMQISQVHHTLQTYKPNVLIEVPIDVFPFDFESVDVDEIVEKGYTSALEKL